jgi:hypothetical protein
MEIQVPGARSEQTTGVYRGPREGQGGVPRRRRPPKAKARRQSVAARRGEDETRRKDGLGRKRKNEGQLRNPGERKLRQLGPTGRARARTDRKERGKQRTAASTSKGSPMAKRRQGNRKAR